MISGYIFQRIESEADRRMQERRPISCHQIPVWENGYLFSTNPFNSQQKTHSASADLICMTEDLIVARDGSGTYRQLDLESDFQDEFVKHGAGAFDTIQNDFRMAVISRTGVESFLYLASNRAGSGRIYYHRLESGIIFSSDLRFLLEVVPLDVNRQAIYSILKYGSVLEPLTISRNASAVPAAHYLKYNINRGRESTHPYFRFQFSCETGRKSAGGTAALGPVRDTLKRSAGFLSRNPTAMLLSGGIDSSLYGCYLNEAKQEPLQGYYCAFGQEDPEFPFARAIAQRIGASLHVASMGQADALGAVENAVRLTDHPFSDFSSLPIVFILKFIQNHVSPRAMVIECNGGDDCFGFPALREKGKFQSKHLVPGNIKKWLAHALRRSQYWKWESSEGTMARIAALADVHELTASTYFLVLAPVNYLALEVPAEWDAALHGLIENNASTCAGSDSDLSYEAKTTIRQLLYVNSARWAAKALSVGESLGLRVVYPFIWRDVLAEQGKLPWSAKVHEGITKWPLKKLLEEFMPVDFIYRKKSGFVPPLVRWLADPEFNLHVREVLLRNNGFVTEIIPARIIDELLTDAVRGKRLRFPVLNLLWGALFAESWIQRYKKA